MDPQTPDMSYSSAHHTSSIDRAVVLEPHWQKNEDFNFSLDMVGGAHHDEISAADFAYNTSSQPCPLNFLNYLTVTIKLFFFNCMFFELMVLNISTIFKIT